METQKEKHSYLVIQYKWQDDWIDCTDERCLDKVHALSRLIMLRSERSGITYRLIKRTEEEIA